MSKHMHAYEQAPTPAFFGIFIQKNAIAFVTMAWRFFMLYLPLAGLGVFFVLAANDARRLGGEPEAGAELPVVEPALEEA